MRAAEAADRSGPPGCSRSRAVHAGLTFIQRMGETMMRNPRLHARYGSDLLLPFTIRRPAQTTEEARALDVATRLATAWRSRHAGRVLPPDTPPSHLLDLMQGLYALESLGLSKGGLRAQVTERCASWRASDFLRYDPRAGEPSPLLREDCPCGAKPAPGSSSCDECKRPSVPMSAFDVYLEAIVHTFHACRMGIPLGACFFNVLRQLAAATMRVTTAASTGARLSVKDRHYLAYALTHVIYALSNFDERSLPPDLFPQPFREALRSRLAEAIAAKDIDLSAELLDCLSTLGQGEAEESQRAVQFILSAQKPDGGWLCGSHADQFSRYHATVVAVGALLKHSYVCCEPVLSAASLVLPTWFAIEGSAASEEACRLCCNGSLCSVDHTRVAARKAAAEAESAVTTLEVRWPLPPDDCRRVVLLPVERRIEIRVGVLNDKVRQHEERLRQQMRLKADLRFVHTAVRSSGAPAMRGGKVGEEELLLLRSRLRAEKARKKLEHRLKPLQTDVRSGLVALDNAVQKLLLSPVQFSTTPRPASANQDSSSLVPLADYIRSARSFSAACTRPASHHCLFNGQPVRMGKRQPGS
jgi:hypothetical protein